MRTLLASALACALVPLAACSDSRCNPASCQLLLDCHSTLPGATDSTCLSSALAEGFLLDAGNQYCVNACNADGNGALLACVAQSFSQSSCQAIGLDGGDVTAALEQTCEGTPRACGANCQSCSTQCSQTQQACNQACADAGSDPATCFPCNYACNQALVDCQAACPTN